MYDFWPALLAEIRKAKGSFAVWLSLAGAVANVFIFLGISLWTIDWAGTAGQPWRAYILAHYEGIAFMMLPLYVVILASLVAVQEHQPGMWSQLFTLPLSRGAIYFGKLFFVLLLFLAAHLLFILGMLASGLAAGLLAPASGLLEAAPSPGLIGLLAAKTFVSILGLLAFQYWLSLRFRHFIVPLTIGILGFVGVSIMGPDWPGANYLFYAYPIQFMPDFTGDIAPLPRWGGRLPGEWLSIGYFLLFGWLGYLDVRRMDW